MSGRADIFDPIDGEEELELEGQEEGHEVELEPVKEEKKGKQAEEDVEIEIAKDPVFDKKDWVKDPAELTEDPNDADYGKRVKQRLGKLKAANTELTRQREKERLEKEELARFARQQQNRIIELEQAYAAGSVKTLESNAEAEDRSAKLAEKEYREALTAGDADKMIEAQSKMTASQVKAAQVRQSIESSKIVAASRPTAQQVAERQQVQQQPQTPQKAVEWYQRNPWFSPTGGDELSDLAIRVHKKLEAEGADLNSDQYFSTIDKKLRADFPERFGLKPKSSPVTPGQRTVNQQAKGVSGNKITLTQAQVAAARSMGFDTPEKLKRYALEVKALSDKGGN